MNTESYRFAERFGVVGGAGIVALYLMPLVIFGRDAVVPVLDVLDSSITLFKVLVESGKMFASSSELIPAVMNGLPRGSFGSELNILVWMFYFLDDYAAHALNEAILHFTAFFGMFVFLKTHIVKGKNSILVVLPVSVLFALLPFFPYFGLAIAGMPLLLFSFLNTRIGKDKWYDWMIICGLPFYSFFPSVGVFVVVSLGMIVAYDLLLRKRFQSRFAAAILVHCAINVLVEYRLVSEMLIGGGGFVSHRLERAYQEGASLSSVWNLAFDMFWNGQYHAASSHTLFLPIILLSVVVGFRDRGLRYVKILGLAVVVVAAIALGHGLWFWSGLDPLKQHVEIMRTFQFNRFYVLNPVLWFVSLACALCIINGSLPRLGKYISVVAVLVVGGVLFGQNQAYAPIEHKAKAILLNREERPYSDVPSYAQFFSSSLFHHIEQYIGRPKQNYRVVCIGFHPAIAQYNGFYTLDGYFGNYPLAYKHQFRRIIEGELAKSEKWRKYFDKWGNRAYVFVNELEDSDRPFMQRKDDNVTVENLSLNPEALRDLKCAYVFSAVRIKNVADNDLQLEQVFEEPDSFWRVYLYGLTSSANIGSENRNLGANKTQRTPILRPLKTGSEALIAEHTSF